MGEKYKLIIKDLNGIKEKLIDFKKTKIGPNASKKIKETIGDHLCWKDCECAYVSKCPKIADAKKKNISEYDFIKRGYQIYNENGELDDFGVFECDNYKYKDPYNKSNLNLKEINYLKASIFTNYFGVETVDEANMIQYELAERGQLLNARTVSKQKYLDLKRNKKRKK